MKSKLIIVKRCFFFFFVLIKTLFIRLVDTYQSSFRMSKQSVKLTQYPTLQQEPNKQKTKVMNIYYLNRAIH